MFYRLFIGLDDLYFLESVDQLARIASQVTGKDFNEIKRVLENFRVLSHYVKEKIPEDILKIVFFDYSVEKKNYISSLDQLPSPFLDISRYISKKNVDWNLLENVYSFLEKCSNFIKNISQNRDVSTSFDEPELVYSSEEKDVKVYYLPSEKASAKFCKYGKWCITGENISEFNSYRFGKRRGYPVSFYIVIVISRDEGYIIEVPEPNKSSFDYYFSDKTNKPYPCSWEEILAVLPNLDGLQHLFKFRPITPAERKLYQLSSKSDSFTVEDFLQFDKSSFSIFFDTYVRSHLFYNVPRYIFLLSPIEYKREFLFNYIDLTDETIFQFCNVKPGERFSDLSKTRVVAAKKMFFKNPDTFSYLSKETFKKVVPYFTKRGEKLFEKDSVLPLEEIMDKKEIDNFKNENRDDSLIGDVYLDIISNFFNFYLQAQSDSLVKYSSAEEILDKILDKSYLFFDDKELSFDAFKNIFFYRIKQKTGFKNFEISFDFLNKENFKDISLIFPRTMSSILSSETKALEKILDEDNFLHIIENKIISDLSYNKFFEAVKSLKNKLNWSNKEIKEKIFHLLKSEDEEIRQLYFLFYNYGVIDLKEESDEDVFILFKKAVSRDKDVPELYFRDKIINEFLSRDYHLEPKYLSFVSKIFFGQEEIIKNVKMKIKDFLLYKEKPEKLYHVIVYGCNKLFETFEKGLFNLFVLQNIDIEKIHRVFLNRHQKERIENFIINSYDAIRPHYSYLGYFLQNFSLRKDSKDILNILLNIDSQHQSYSNLFQNLKQNLLDRYDKLYKIGSDSIHVIHNKSFIRFPSFFKEHIVKNEEYLNRFLEDIDFSKHNSSVRSKDSISAHLLLFVEEVYKENKSKLSYVFNLIKNKILAISNDILKKEVCFNLLFNSIFYIREIELRDYIFNEFYKISQTVFGSSEKIFVDMAEFLVSPVFTNTHFSHSEDIAAVSRFLDVFLEKERNIFSMPHSFAVSLEKIFDMFNIVSRRNEQDVLEIFLDKMIDFLEKKANSNPSYVSTISGKIKEILLKIPDKMNKKFGYYFKKVLDKQLESVRKKSRRSILYYS